MQATFQQKLQAKLRANEILNQLFTTLTQVFLNNWLDFHREDYRQFRQRTEREI